ncbi:AAA family ATPase [Pontibacter flavimaris]|uniref:DUF4435 domain-containing protein n=1 Tax=Pontibacter flavimaris TaxID=1797110 RepID=A0A1Q5PDZ7_9BACT|nr:AAA family ATPase [Pontibacter flavimaris]OKL40446.1 hypothetical protein A3841_19270 [Pontibacter flavimaris]
MRINSIKIENFRAIKFLELNELSDAIVVAGPNGSGKSSIFDAIRLLKSAYGEYFQNEFQSWFAEFQINFQRIHQEGHRLLNDPTKPFNIHAEFKLSTKEKEYIRENCRSLAFKKINSNQHSHHPEFNQMLHPMEQQGLINDTVQSIEQEIFKDVFPAHVWMLPSGEMSFDPSPVLELLFSTYEPQSLGVIEYQGASRNYVREQIGGINLQVTEFLQRNSQHALYNTQNKYHGVKTEMAQSFIRQLLAEKAGITIPKEEDLKQTLDELFSIFFPRKKFLGAIPTPDGGLSFPVELENGAQHDINELSSGEKEVLIGYLRLRNNAPKNSMILIDEPELHLNPRLIRGLPRFYQKHLGEALDNQLWLITHSDTLLREAVEEPAYTVYHMHSSYTTEDGSNQLVPIAASGEMERTVIDLMGDLSTYSPRSKVILLEGEDSEVDANILKELFPNFVENVNLVSVGSKNRVGVVHDILERAAQGGRLSAQFYSIVDKDFEGNDLVESNRRFKWDVYHIENYLLVPKFIQEVMKSLMLGKEVPNEDQIKESLKICAESTVPSMVRIKLESIVNRELVNCISTRFDPRTSLPIGFREATERSFERMTRAVEKLSADYLSAEEQRIKAEFTTALEDDSWISKFRGRDTLKEFTSRHQQQIKVPYETFRNLIINRMRDAEYAPEGMARVIEAIQG